MHFSVLFMLLIHSADLKSRLVVIIIFTDAVRTSICLYVRPSFQNLSKYRKTKQLNITTMFAIGGTVGLAEWIIDNTSLVAVVFVVANAV